MLLIVVILDLNLLDNLAVIIMDIASKTYSLEYHRRFLKYYCYDCCKHLIKLAIQRDPFAQQ